MKIAVKNLNPNPFRSLEHYSIRRDKVDALKASISSTEFWDNLLARKNGAGYEIAYGHHRLAALQELKIDEIDVPVRDLDDEAMLKIMANENMAEWGASALIEQETIRATVQAFADGKIKLPKVKEQKSRDGNVIKLRIAPGFMAQQSAKFSRENLAKAYTAKTLARFLGWPKAKVANTLHALAMIEEGVGKDIDFAGLSPKQAEVVVRETRFAEKESGDKTVAAEIGVKLADEFRSTSGDDKPKASIHTARARTERLLRDNMVERIVAKKQAKKDKAELERFDNQVKEFLAANKTWLQAIKAATKAISKFSPEAKRFTVRRLDQSITAEIELKDTLAVAADA